MVKKMLVISLLALPWADVSAAPVLEHRYEFENSISDSVGSTEASVMANSSYLNEPDYVSEAPPGSEGSSLRLGQSAGKKKSGFTLDGTAVSMTEGSYSFWIKPQRPAGSSARYITAAVNKGPKVYLKGGGSHLAVQAGDSGGKDIRARLEPLDTWHHIAFTWNGLAGEFHLYIDGKLVGKGTCQPQSIQAEQIRFGAFNFVDKETVLDSQFVGLLDDLQIYSGILDEAAVSYLAANPGSTFQP